MPTKSIGKAKLKTTATGKTKLEPVRTYDVSKTRRIATSKKQTVVAPARARGARS